MKKNYYGITLETNDFPPNVDIKNFAARLFIAPRLSVDSAKKILSILSSIKFSNFFSSTSQQIEEILGKQRNGIDVSSFYSGKMQDWVMQMGKLSHDELQYIEETFGINQEVFGKDIRHSIVDRRIRSPRDIAKQRL
jgi:hypothetical protein